MSYSNPNPAFKQLLIGILAVLGFLTTGVAQHNISTTYTEAEGLASSMVYDIAQDTSGRMWFARRSGISSYDGLQFTNYNQADGLKPGTYAFIHLDEKGILWALPESGELCVSKYDGQKWSTECGHLDSNMLFGPNYLAFDVFYQEGNCVLAVGTEKNGLFLRVNRVWKQWTMDNGLPSNYIQVVRGIGKDIYIGSDKGISMIRNDRIINNPVYLPPIPSGAIHGLTQKGGKIWLLGVNWLGYLENGKFISVNRDFVLPQNRYLKSCFLSPDDQGNVFFGNPFGAFFYNSDLKKVQVLDRKDGLISEGGSSVFFDRELNTWISGFRGITKISSKRFVTYSASDGLFSNEVASAMEIRPGYYVFGHNCALSYFNGSKFSHLILDPLSYKHNYESRVLDMDKDDAGNLWLAVSSLGIARVDPDRNVRWFKEESGIKGIAYSIEQTPQGKIFAGTPSGLYEMKGDKFNAIKLLNVPQPGIRKIFSGPDNSLYLTTISHGVIQYKEGRTFVYLPHDNPLAKSTYAFLIDKDNRKWVGTAAGLFFLSDSVMRKMNEGGLCINKPVYLIVEDYEGFLWFGSDNGLYRWNGSKLDHFSTRDGISGLEINRDAGFLDHENHLWFGTSNGLTVFRPEYDYDLSKAPAPLVHPLFLEVGNDTLFPGKKIVLSYDRNNLAFHFQVLSFTDERRIFFKYRLENLDTAWSKEIPYDNPVIRINNLMPGTYTLQIKACNALGIWSDPVSFSEIRIKQPFWFQWWFLGLFFIALGVIVFFAGRFILIARYSSKLKQMVALRTAELTESNAAKDNFFSIIAHDLKSPFNVILGMLDLLTGDYDEYTEEERKNMLFKLKNAAIRTINLLENLLTWARSQKGLLPVVPEEINLNDLIDENLTLLESSAHNKKISLFKTYSENFFVTADRNMTHVILRNLISNAIKFTYPEGKVEVVVSKKNDEMIEVAVKDNGCGMSAHRLNRLFRIDARIATKGTDNEIGTGLGLILCLDFVEKNKGSIHVTSQEGKGSTFYFTLPMFKVSGS